MIDFIKKLLVKYREQIAYLFFGVLTTLVSWGSSSALYYFAFGKTNTALCNVLSEIIAVTFAYVTNKLFVFCSKTANFKEFLKEILLFYALRAFSSVINVGAMTLFVDVCKLEFWVCKIAVNAVVIILNYFFSKLFVFKDKNKKEGECENAN